MLYAGAFLSLALAVRVFAGVVLARAAPRAPFVRAIRIDLNRATLGELTALPGIGKERAAAIVLHRVRHGPFRSANDLLRVGGIGEQTLRPLLPFVEVEAAR